MPDQVPADGGGSYDLDNIPSLLEVMEAEQGSTTATEPDVEVTETPDESGVEESTTDSEGEVEVGESSDESESAVGAEAPEEDDEDWTVGSKPADFGFDPNNLTEEQRPVHAYWRALARRKGNEFKRQLDQVRTEFKDKYGDLDPKVAEEALRVNDYLLNHEHVEVIKALINPEHPNHAEVFEKLGIGQKKTTSSKDLIQAATRRDENGDLYIDTDALESAIQQRLQQSSTRNPAQDDAERNARAASMAKQAWDLFAREHKLPSTELAEYERIYVEDFGGVCPPRYRGKPLEFFAVLKKHRDMEISDSMAQDARKLKTPPRGNVRRPTLRAPSAPPKPLVDTTELTLEQVAQMEKEGRI